MRASTVEAVVEGNRRKQAREAPVSTHGASAVGATTVSAATNSDDGELAAASSSINIGAVVAIAWLVIRSSIWARNRRDRWAKVLAVRSLLISSSAAKACAYSSFRRAALAPH